MAARHALGRIHEAKGRGEDKPVAGAGELLDDALGVGALGHLLDEGGLDAVAELPLQRLSADIVLVGPAMVAHRADIDEADLQLLLRERIADTHGRGHGGQRCGEKSPSIHGATPIRPALSRPLAGMVARPVAGIKPFGRQERERPMDIP